jgi:hypothetical protein
MSVHQELLGSVQLRDILNSSRPCLKHEQHVVGKSYWCAYWRYTYTVTALVGDYLVVTEMADGTPHSHMTPLDWRRDRVLTTTTD